MSLSASWHQLRSKPWLHGSTFLAALLPALWLLRHGYERRWATDDGLINVRVVQQLMAGHGFVYNAGERTEVVTSAAWVLVLWLAGELGCNVETAAWVLSLGSSALGLFLAAIAVARLQRRIATSGSVVLPLGVLAYAAIPVAWEYTTSALENGLGIGFLGAAYYLVARAVTAEPKRSLYATAAFCGLAPLVRPDFALFGGAFVLLLCLLPRAWRQRLLVGGCAALPGLVYQTFRMGYFACLVPNTALAKEAFGSRWDQGSWYVNDMLHSYELLWPLLAGAVCLVWSTYMLRRAQQTMLALVPLAMAGAGALHLLYVMRVGGDFMHGRMTLPGLFALLASVAVVQLPVPRLSRVDTGARLRALASGALVWGALLLTAGWSVYCSERLSFLPSEDTIRGGINDERYFYVGGSQLPHPTRIDHFHAHHFYKNPTIVRGQMEERCPTPKNAEPDAARTDCARVAIYDGEEGVLSDQPAGTWLPLEPSSVAPFVVAVMGFRPLGIAGLAVGLHINVVDGFSLADSLAARMEIPQRGRPGHEKLFSTWWFAAKYIADGATQDERALTAKRVLGCGLIAELQAATHEPMSLSRFVRNIKLSFALHGLRIPVDPHEAERKFCTPTAG